MGRSGEDRPIDGLPQVSHGQAGYKSGWPQVLADSKCLAFTLTAKANISITPAAIICLEAIPCHIRQDRVCPTKWQLCVFLKPISSRGQSKQSKPAPGVSMWQCQGGEEKTRVDTQASKASKHRSAFRRTHHHCQPALASVFAPVASILSHCKALLCTLCTLCPLCMTAVNFACIQTQLGQFFWRCRLPKASVQSSALFARMHYAATTKDPAPMSSDFWRAASDAALYTSVKCSSKKKCVVRVFGAF